MNQSEKRKIVFVHLLNDYSGSPLVLSNVIKGLQQKGFSNVEGTTGYNESNL